MNISSYCVFGDLNVPRYWGAIRGIVWAHHHIFPGWELRIYHDNLVEKHGQALKRYHHAGLVNAVPCGETPPIGVGALWRYKAIWDQAAEYVLTRDIDSLPLVRDRLMVDEFMETGMAMHSISDHPDQSWHMQAGMVGFHAPKFRDRVFFTSWDAMVGKASSYGIDMSVWQGGPDQQLLSRLVWPLMADEVCEHRLKGVQFTGSGGKKFDRVPERQLSDVPAEVQDGADTLMPFMGCPGFDVDRAVAFFKKYGRAEVTQRLERAEAL